jgi:inorganic pyrophosphatase
MLLDRIPAHNKENGTVQVVIETPRGCRNKYAYDPKLGVMVLRKVLPEGHVFPYDFGFVPQSEGGDGDPVDVLVLMDEPAFAGCLVECRLIGLIEAKQIEDGKSERNDRYIAVAEKSLRYGKVRDLRALGEEVVEQIQHFFVSYNEMAGKRFKPLRVVGPAPARKALKRCLKMPG